VQTNNAKLKDVNKLGLQTENVGSELKHVTITYTIVIW